METLINTVNAWVWGAPMLALIGGTGLFLMVVLQWQPLRKIGFAFRQLYRGRRSDQAGDITPFRALMTSLSATVGTGNIAGVATAIYFGGPGALFWMWMIALVGMATKFAEAVLAVRYRQTDANGQYIGGPMYYIRDGLGPKWGWLAGAFAVFGMIAGFGIGNAVQAHSVADVLHSEAGIPGWVTGLVLMTLTGAVLLGGIQRIAAVAGRIVPIMSLAYVGAGLCVILWHLGEVPDALALILTQAFQPTSAAAGGAGASVWLAILWGVKRGVFSNEAGLGSAPIAHAAARTDHPVRQGTIAMLGTFIDTLIVCTVTGLVIVVTGFWDSGLNGAPLTSAAFGSALPLGEWVVSLGLMVFAFTTILGWSYYSEKCTQFLFGVRAIVVFRCCWVLMVPVGAMFQEELRLVWNLADTLNALMALPNLIALVLLSPVVVKLTRDFFQSKTHA